LAIATKKDARLINQLETVEMSTEANETTGETGGKASKQVTNVVMEDGRTVAFAGKRRQVKSEDWSDDGEWQGTRIDFINGKTLYYKAPAMDEKLKNGHYTIHEFAAHGASQKFGDATAGYKEHELDDAVIAVDNVMGRVVDGEWSVEREGGGSFAGTSILILALVELTGKTYEQLKDWLKGKSKEEKDAMRNSDKLRPIVQKLEAERAAKTAHVDTKSLFDELDATA
jgi:hypothetical protein